MRHLERRSPFNPLPLKSQFFMSFVRFMLFLFRLLESMPNIGLLSCNRARNNGRSDFAWLAAVHHEKLDGSGYPWGLRGDVLDEPSRILAVADIYEALSADRPYRAGMSYAQALEILKKESGEKICANAVTGLELAADDIGR